MNTLAILSIIACISLILTQNAKPSCPRYSCGSNPKLSCAHSTYNTTLLYQEVVLENNCKNSQICIDGWKEGAGPFYSFQKRESDFTMECGDYDLKYAGIRGKPISYPGEACKATSDCSSSNGFISTCENGKCTGKKINETCADTQECLVGHYCKMSSEVKGVCTPQLKLDEVCDSQKDNCVNGAICFKGKCIRLFSLPAGTKLEKGGDSLITGLFCDTAYATEDGYCAKTTYANKATSKFITCNLGEDCIYNVEGSSDLTNRTIVQECGCGYNAKGQGYCPLSFNADPAGWNDYINRLRKDWDNDCHLYNREYCAASKGMVYNFIAKSPLTAHFYEGAVSCVSSGFLSVSGILVMILALFL